MITAPQEQEGKMSSYEMVKSPLTIGDMTLKNRIIMGPMGTMYCAAGGFVTDTLIAYYAERAAGGPAMIVTEHTGISEEGCGYPTMLRICSDAHEPGYTKLVDAIHAAGAKHAVELNYSGRDKDPADFTVEHMEQIAQDWASAAVRAKKCGTDAVIVHLAAGYLLHRFLTPRINQRTDEFGGSLENRARFPRMVMRAVKKAVGEDYPLWFRISIEEGLTGGFTREDSKQIIDWMIEDGAMAVDLSNGAQESPYLTHPTYYKPDAVYMELAKEIKEHVSVPVIAAGKVKDLATAEAALAEGCCDAVVMARALLADPQIVNKSLAGHEDEVMTCLSCLTCNKSARKGRLQCAVNPCAGHEAEIIRTPVSDPKKVLIIGAGITGLTCAAACAMAGHSVVVAEAGDHVGGHAVHAAIPPHKELMNRYIARRKAQAQQLGAEIRYNTKVTAENIADFGADVVVAANGATPRIPTFLPGYETMTNLLTFEDVLTGSDPEKAGQNLLILGGGEVGAEMADYLCSYGRKCTIIEMTHNIISDAAVQVQHDLGERLQKYGVEIYTDTKVTGFDHNKVNVVDADGNPKVFEGYDNVILSMGLVAAGPSIAKELEGKVENLIVIGDADRPQGIAHAVEQAVLVPTQI